MLFPVSRVLARIQLGAIDQLGAINPLARRQPPPWGPQKEIDASPQRGDRKKRRPVATRKS